MFSTLSGLADIARLRPGVRRMRAASWDPSGGNDDFWTLAPGETRTIASLAGPGCIRHIWMTMEGRAVAWPRRIVLRAWWDGEPEPSVEVPIGDFFGIGHGIIKNFTCAPFQMSPQDGRAFNCWFPMPLASAARLEVTNETAADYVLYFYLDYETYGSSAAGALERDYGRFHAQWRRQNPTDGWADPAHYADWEWLKAVWRTPNLDGAGNYVILEAAGRGHYVGCHLDVDVFERYLKDDGKWDGRKIGTVPVYSSNQMKNGCGDLEDMLNSQYQVNYRLYKKRYCPVRIVGGNIEYYPPGTTVVDKDGKIHDPCADPDLYN